MAIWNGSPLGFSRDGRPISYDGNAATLIIGPPGSQKSVGAIAPLLLDEPGQRSFVVIDPKGEIAAITSRYRRSVGDVKNINPYGLLTDVRPDLRSDKWNPLGELDPASRSFGDDCAAICGALIKTDPGEHQKHFPDSARAGSTGTTMFTVRDARSRGAVPLLAAVREIMCLEPKALREAVEAMIAGGDYDIRTRLQKFLAENNEIAGVKNSVEVATEWMTPPMRDDMNTGGGVKFRDIKRRPTTIYVILPTEELQRKSIWLRLVLSTALRACYQHGGVPVTLVIEEGFVLGHHAEIEAALSILRGFNSRMTIPFQSLAQIKQLYPHTWGLFGNGAVLSFRPGDLETAEWLSKRSGEVTVTTLSASDPSSPTDYGVRPNWQQQKRPRIPIGKWFAMPQGVAAVWLPGDEAPRVSRVRGYFDIPELNRRASPNPYFSGSSASHSSAGGGRGGGGVAAALGIMGALAALWALAF
jgi:type IV secretion system protein VirD4